MCAQRLAASKIVSPPSGSYSPGPQESAQRLAASKIVSRARSPDPNVSIRCSTPCGIKDSFTKKISKSNKRYDSAQRLAASKIVSHQDELMFTSLLIGAQRLAASKIVSQ